MNSITETEKIFIRGTEADGSFDVAAADSGNTVGLIRLEKSGEWSYDGIVFFTEPEQRRKGYAADAVHSFTRWYYDTHEGDMLTAVVPLENVPAIRTLERAGYEYIRTLRLNSDENDVPELYHLYACSRETADAGAPPKGCCCGCGGHAD